MENKNKRGNYVFGQGLAYSLKEVTELVRALFQGINMFFENLLMRGKWLLILVFITFTVPYMMENKRIERVTAVINDMVNNYSENRRKTIDRKAMAEGMIMQISLHESAKIRLQQQEALIHHLSARLHMLDVIKDKETESSSNLHSVKESAPYHCSDNSRTRYSYTDGCDYNL